MTGDATEPVRETPEEVQGSEAITLRIPLSALAEIAQAMKLQGFANRSEWIRAQAIRAARQVIADAPVEAAS